jgi:formylglycine-generating enzyme required for sulfatase activity
LDGAISSDRGAISRFVEATKHKPEEADSLHDLPNRPVVNVPWYEAVKFCEWLKKKWQHENKLPKDWTLHLPSEAEWEKAARGGLKIPAQPIIKSIDTLSRSAGITASLRDNPEPKRRYPWGNEPDPNCANYNAIGIGATSAVGCFPNGESPYGLDELSGNVWEWTRSLSGDYPYPVDEKGRAARENLRASEDKVRVLRGGAFFNDFRYVRCAYRDRDFPFSRVRYLGFRVAVLPLSF